MPTYQYACTECDERLEVRQSFTDDALTECPACEGRLRKVFNAVGVVFKGSGFYKTDSRTSPGSGDRSGADKGGDARGDTGSGTGSGKDSGKDSGKGSGSSSGSGDSSSSSQSSAQSSAKSTSSAA